MSFFGYEFTTRTQQYSTARAAVVVLVALHFVSESRTGRALRALRRTPSPRGRSASR